MKRLFFLKGSILKFYFPSKEFINLAVANLIKSLGKINVLSMMRKILIILYFLCTVEIGAIQNGFAASGLYPCFNRAFFITFASSAAIELQKH